MFTAVFSRGGWHGVGKRLGMAMTWVNKSFSAGRVSLQSLNPQDEPKVELNYFDDQRDFTRLKDGLALHHRSVRYARRFARRRARRSARGYRSGRAMRAPSISRIS